MEIFLSSSRLALQSPKCPPQQSFKNPNFSSLPNPSRFTLTTKKKRIFTVNSRHSDFFKPQQQQQQQQQKQSIKASETLPSQVSVPRVFVGHSIYKGKAALNVTPRAPLFAPLDNGSYKISKEGFLLLEFAPAVGVRQYDWTRKQIFSLSATEIGTLMGLGARDSCEFFHDPNKGKGDEGKVRKVLKSEPLPDGSGRFFNLSVQNKLTNTDESIYIPITKAEFTVLVSLFSFILPYLLGWHAFANSIKTEDFSSQNNSRSDFEWSR